MKRQKEEEKKKKYQTLSTALHRPQDTQPNKQYEIKVIKNTKVSLRTLV
jgi:hypothetical protein